MIPPLVHHAFKTKHKPRVEFLWIKRDDNYLSSDFHFAACERSTVPKEFVVAVRRPTALQFFVLFNTDFLLQSLAANRSNRTAKSCPSLTSTVFSTLTATHARKSTPCVFNRYPVINGVLMCPLGALRQVSPLCGCSHMAPHTRRHRRNCTQPPPASLWMQPISRYKSHAHVSARCDSLLSTTSLSSLSAAAPACQAQVFTLNTTLNP